MSETNKLEELKKQIRDCAVNAFNEGYKAGLKDGDINNGTFAAKVKEAYDNGLNDAEKARVRLISAVSDGGLSMDEIIDIFDATDYEAVFENFTICEIIERIKEYDERKRQEVKKVCDDEIHIGDEIYKTNRTHKYIVTAFLDNDGIFVLGDDGFTVVFTCDEIHKTGRNYPIKAILKELGNGEE